MHLDTLRREEMADTGWHYLRYIAVGLQKTISKDMVTQFICIYAKHTVYPRKYAYGFCFAVLCCGYTLTDFPISTRLTSLALWQSNDCPSTSKATLMNMDKYFMWIHYERLHDHNKAKHNKTVCIFLGIYCICDTGPRHVSTMASLPHLQKIRSQILCIHK